jgi:hypothetical protein
MNIDTNKIKQRKSNSIQFPTSLPFLCRVLDTKKTAGLRILWIGAAGVIKIRMIKPYGIVNHNLTFKPDFYRVYQNVAPPTIVSLGRRPQEGAFLL